MRKMLIGTVALFVACSGSQKRLFPVDKANLQAIYDEVSEGYVGLREQVVRQPQGCLQYPYLIPAGFYQNLWDWDAFFMANHFISRGETQYMRDWVKLYAELADETGYVSGSLTPEGARPMYSKYAPMKPLLAQGAYHYSVAAGDFSWIAPYYESIKKVVDYQQKNRYDEKYGLYFWEIAMFSGADNNPALNYWDGDSRSYLCTDASAFMYGEMLSLAVIARELGNNAESEQFTAAAQAIKENLNKYCWNEKDQCYYNVDRENSQQYPRVSYSSFVPLMYKMAPKKEGRELLKRYMLNPESMRSDYGFRSLSKADPEYNNKNIIKPFSNWQGPIWCITNYIYSIALKHYGFEKEIAWMAEVVGELIVKDLRTFGTMHETYHAETGEPLAPSSFKYKTADGRIQGFVSWNLCMQNVMEGALQNKWMLLEIEGM